MEDKFYQAIISIYFPNIIAFNIFGLKGYYGVVAGWVNNEKNSIFLIKDLLVLFKKGSTNANGSGTTSNVLRQATIPILPLAQATSFYGQLPSTQLYAGLINSTSPRDSCKVYYLLI